MISQSVSEASSMRRTVHDAIGDKHLGHDRMILAQYFPQNTPCGPVSSVLPSVSGALEPDDIYAYQQDLNKRPVSSARLSRRSVRPR